MIEVGTKGTVTGPAEGTLDAWRSPAEVVGVAPFSACVCYARPGCAAVCDWFSTDPNLRPGQRHGDPPEFALRFEADA